MIQNDYSSLLVKAGVRPTANRVLIYSVIMAADTAFSMSDIEVLIPQLDKSTIFRTLTLFNEHHIVHSTEDAGGVVKYCVRDNNEGPEENESHCHFYCENCGRTYCLDKSIVNDITLPKGFVMRGINYLAKGICAECAKRQEI